VKKYNIESKSPCGALRSLVHQKKKDAHIGVLFWWTIQDLNL
jgi:hypothetical protein